MHPHPIAESQPSKKPRLSDHRQKPKQFSNSALPPADSTASTVFVGSSDLHRAPESTFCLQPTFVELFCGCARLSLVASQQGFNILPIDGPRNEHRPETKIMTLDLTDPVGQEVCMQHVTDLKPRMVHIALPCGTGSRAREKPIPVHLLRQGAPQPKPLRNECHIMGVPGLSELDQVKVDAANALSLFVIRLLILSLDTPFDICVENPANSWMWAVLTQLVLKQNNPALTKKWNEMNVTTFSNCNHGGMRPKKTSFRCTSRVFQQLEGTCPGESDSHPHKPYRVNKSISGWTFDTAAESEYPKLLCQRYIECLRNHYQMTSTKSQLERAVVNQTKRHQQLIPEYHRIVEAEKPPNPPHKLLTHTGGEDGRSQKINRYGIFHTKSQFVKAAERLEHPFATRFAIMDDVKKNVFDLAVGGLGKLAKDRLSNMQMITQMSHELSKEEARFHAMLPKHAQDVLKGKRILLWKRLLEMTEFPDIEVADLMKGVPLVGVPNKSPLFASKLCPATTTVDLLLKASRWRNRTIVSRNIHHDEPELSRILWETTLGEVEKGFLIGPFKNEEEVRKHLSCQDFVCSRRFVIMQGLGQSAKPRVIDDLKESGINSAYTSVDHLALHDIDYLASLSLFIAKTFSDKKVNVSLSDGSVLHGDRHRDFSVERKWKGRCLDLSKAYKQVPIDCKSKPLGVLVAHDPVGGGARFFLTQSLPFGACASVYAFNRISRSLLHLLVNLGKITGGVFYDDFPMLEMAESSRLASMVAEHVLDRLGWLFAKGNDKGKPFESSFDVLGVRLNPEFLSSGSFGMRNKESRIERVLEQLDSIKSKGQITKQGAQSVQGLLNFMSGFVMGSSLRVACRAFANLSSEPKVNQQDLIRLCDWTSETVKFLKPRDVQLKNDQQPVIIFSDAAFEDSVATWGIVVIDPASGRREVMGGRVSSFLVDFWMQDAGEQVITQAEAFALALARRCFAKHLMGRRVLAFVDNDPARYAFIKASSPSRTLLQLVQRFHEMAEVDHAVFWIERVPTESNVADLPSRGLSEQAAEVIQGKVISPPNDLTDFERLAMDVSNLPWHLLQKPSKNESLACIMHV